MAEDSVTDDKPKQFLGLSGTQTIGSALAAVASAVVGSHLGVAGTLIGAALGSIVATVATALFTRTLSSATIAAKKKIPQPRWRGLRPGGGGMVTAGAPAEVSDFRAKLARRRFTPRTWLAIGMASAAAFVIAMVGVTAVEFGTNQPISTLVSSTSNVDGGTTGPATTLGEVLGGSQSSQNSPVVPDEAGGPSAPAEEAPGQVAENPVDDGAATDGIPGAGESAPTEDPGTGEMLPSLPAEPAPATEQAPAPAPEQAPAPFSDPGSAGQGGLPAGGGAAGTGQ
jgi:hypothetical protein